MLISTSLSASLSETETEQLSWLEGHEQRSYDMDVYATTNEYSHIEVPRAIVRIRCLELLQDGDSRSYQEFVSAQNTSCLSFTNFKKLSAFIKRLTPNQILLLRKAVIITATSLTPQARAQIPEIEVLNSSLDFSAALVRATNAERQLYCMFPPQTNFRHMLYAESGNNMFKTLQTMIQLKYMGQTELDLWFAYWIVNMAGFRGHVDQRGSIYLTEHIASSMLYLKDLLDQMLLAPEYPVLSNYLQYRVRLIGLQEMPAEQQVVFGHLAGLLNLHTPLQGRMLYASFMQLPSKTRQDLVNFFNCDIHGFAPISYVPALFSNALLYADNDFSLVLSQLLPIYMDAVRLSAGKGASFNQLSQTENIKKLLTLNKSVELTISSAQELSLRQQ